MLRSLLRRRAIGLLAESYSKWERRAPLTPKHVSKIVQNGAQVLVQPSTKRVFPDTDYAAAGAVLTRDLSSAGAIFGVKSPANGSLLEDKTYCFFSHVIKAQPENMELLDEALSKRVRLIDYECIREGGRGSLPRLIAFGEFAGKGGTVSGLRGLGLRLLALGYSTPFLAIGPPHSYADYADACRALKNVGERITAQGLPRAFAPLVVCVAGTGNVSRGAVDALNALGPVVQWVTPSELPALSALRGTEGAHQHKIYGVVTSAADAVALKGDVDGKFDRAHYYANPDEYEPVFHKTIGPHMSMLITTMFWDRRFPRLLSNKQLEALLPQLITVADITCDVDGCVESLVRSTTIDDPFFLFNPATGQEGSKSLDGDGLVMMGVDILPSELPVEASNHFGDKLLPFIDSLLSEAPLPPEMVSATITEGGSLTPRFQYITSMRGARDRSQETLPSRAEPKTAAEARAIEGSTVVSLHGHLFDTGFINAVLDIVEQADGRFDLLEVNVRPNARENFSSIGDPLQSNRLLSSSALLQMTLDNGRPALDAVLQQFHDLSRRMPKAEATIAELPKYCKVFDRTLQPAADLAAAAPPKPEASSVSSSVASSQPPARRIVVLGAGMCAGPAVEWLSRSGHDHITVASAAPGEAEALCESLRRPNLTPITLDVRPESPHWARVGALLDDADGALSLLPQTMHVPIAAECIQRGTALVTASYVSPEFEALNAEAKARGVPLLGEMGLDPGMDHMSALELIDRAHDSGGVVTAFRSLCGGLPSPECASTTPLGYKFSWSPAGVIAACGNAARYRDHGDIVEVGAADLLHSARPLEPDCRLGRTFRLEVLPNRDSLPYAKLYGIEDEAASVFRGTLRYDGWSNLFGEFVGMGLTSRDPLPAGVSTWPELLKALRVPAEVSKERTSQARALNALRSLGAFDETENLGDCATVADALCALLASKLSYAPGERDAVLMEHTMRIEYPHAPERSAELLSSSLVCYGEASGMTAMSKAVGLTAALGVQRLLDPAEERLAGVLRPTLRSVYSYALPRLAGEGLAFEESML